MNSSEYNYFINFDNQRISLIDLKKKKIKMNINS